MATSVTLRSNNVFLPGQDAQPAIVTFDQASGKITAVQTGPSSSSSSDNDIVWDFGDLYVLPGGVDAHVHLNEPGRTEWEGFATGTRAAASGGVTTLIDMPLNSIPPVTTFDGLNEKRAAASGQLSVDVGFWGGVIPSNADDLQPLIASGVKGFKCFLIESGVEEFPCVSEDDLRRAMAKLKGTGSPLLFHAEVDTSISSSHQPPMAAANPQAYSTFLESRPDSFETSAIELVCKLQAEFPSVPCHIVHLSSAAALPIIRKAKAAGQKLTVETCYHYICLEAESIPDGQTHFKCCPPIRSASNRELLWEALLDGTIDYVVSDHSPCVAELKNLETGDFSTAWGGISSLGLGSALLWNEAKKRSAPSSKFGMREIIEWTSERTARMAGLKGVKGEISVGADADFAIFDPEQAFEVTKDTLGFKNKLSPFVGLQLQGRVKETILRGEKIWSSKEGPHQDGSYGRML